MDRYYDPSTSEMVAMDALRNQCSPGVVCTHEGPCSENCGGDHYPWEDGTCLRCGKPTSDNTRAGD
jgi:hypothetical protein